MILIFGGIIFILSFLFYLMLLNEKVNIYIFKNKKIKTYLKMISFLSWMSIFGLSFLLGGIRFTKNINEIFCILF